MIALYEQRFFAVDTTVRPCDIWRFDAVDGFKRCVDDDLVYYEKSVEIHAITEFFEVFFSAKWHGEFYFCEPYFNENTVVLRTSDRQLAEKFAFVPGEEERGQTILWYKTVSLDECSDFRFHKKTYAPEYFTEEKNEAQTKSVIALSREEWAEMHKKTVYELSPWNFTNKN